MSETALVSIVLVSGQIILSEMTKQHDDFGNYLLKNPVRPILVENTIEFVAMNTFSDSNEYLIHKDKIMAIGEMHFQYIDKYIAAVDRIDSEIVKVYGELMKPVAQDSIYIENESKLLN